MNRQQANPRFCRVAAIVFSAFIFTITRYKGGKLLFKGSHFFFSVARAMYSGRILYKDILEQKGLLTYVLYLPGYLISHTSYLGVWLVELLLFVIGIYFVLRIMELADLSGPACIIGLSLFTAVVFWSRAAGAVIEVELFPCFAYSLYSISVSRTKLSTGHVYLNGIMAGIVLWTKFSLLGFYFGFAAVLCLFSLRDGLLAALKCAGVFLAGMITVSLPCLLYFYLGNAVGELVKYYFLNNVFDYGYGYQEFSVKNLIINYLVDVPAWNMQWNPLLFPVICLGIPAVLLSRRTVYQKSLAIAAFLCNYLTSFSHGAMFDYYLMGFSVYAVYAVTSALKLSGRLLAGWTVKEALKRVAACCGAVLIIAALIVSQAVRGVFSYDYHEMVQYRFAEYMHAQKENPTSLDYGILDYGFYMAADITPTTWAYCHLNWNNSLMDEDQLNSVREKKTDFVVTSKDVEIPAVLEENYYPVMEGKASGIEFVLYEKR